ncbi:acyl-CoA dehydrogenase family protein [Sinomonas atrocyanea]|uniref:acyl-CoA dehydrogenase family protein n=1 Tax=Sinomonas atrocyanea TaxID=37927 RepID=UPI0027878710|nr:acyl-CoA dehydrogenase family protein [Sinomonas atrocyanea]MDQ0261200.1 alkylation response protein AidB-like acyl-CoA dehydrogenase [Sinomonas atrocyanea]MDR6619866.1 alkylation response protein AidB-like acyl-CoA dehydrogenase [Sinomonas atrocyanea]
MALDPAAVLADGLLEEIRSRAPGYDERNEFFQEDLDALVAAAYLKAFVPEGEGGLGAGVADVVRLQRRLAQAAPATALAVNMHLVWTGVAKMLADRGDASLAFVLDEAAAGEVFAFGVSEAGNDAVLFDSVTEAVPQPDGGYSFTGTKVFTSLAPAWTRMGTFGKDTTGEEPALVWGFIRRDRPGWRHLDDWNTLGMRASQSRTTVLEGAVAPSDRIVRRLPVGPHPDLLVFGIFAVFETLLAAVYTGIAERALDLAVEAAHRRRSHRSGGRPYSQDPDIRWQIAELAMAVDAIVPQLDAVAADLDAGADRGSAWFRHLSGLKHRATQTAKAVVDGAMRVGGGGGYFRGHELERLYRDVLAGLYHPSDPESAHSTVATNLLGPLED